MDKRKIIFVVYRREINDKDDKVYDERKKERDITDNNSPLSSARTTSK